MGESQLVLRWQISGAKDEQSFLVSVNNINNSPQLIDYQQSWYEGWEFNYDQNYVLEEETELSILLEVSDADFWLGDDYTFHISSNDKLDWLEFSTVENHPYLIEISGLADDIHTGSHSLTFVVTDNEGASYETEEYLFDILNINEPVSLIDKQRHFQNWLIFTYQIEFVDEDSSENYHFSSLNLPLGCHSTTDRLIDWSAKIDDALV